MGAMTLTTEQQLAADISSNNASFHAAAYKSAGHAMVAIKATQGNSYVNPDYHAWVADAHQHKLAVVHYHFAMPADADGLSEAAHFWATIKDNFIRPGDYAALDVEQGTIEQAKAWTASADLHLHEYGLRPWLYTFDSFYQQGLGVKSGENWLAAWGSNKPAVRKGDRLVAWQYTDGVVGPEPHVFAGIGQCDGSRIDAEMATEMVEAHA